jgi:hypothetical protein
LTPNCFDLLIWEMKIACMGCRSTGHQLARSGLKKLSLTSILVRVAAFAPPFATLLLSLVPFPAGLEHAAAYIVAAVSFYV